MRNAKCEVRNTLSGMSAGRRLGPRGERVTEMGSEGINGERGMLKR